MRAWAVQCMYAVCVGPEGRENPTFIHFSPLGVWGWGWRWGKVHCGGRGGWTGLIVPLSGALK